MTKTYFVQKRLYLDSAKNLGIFHLVLDIFPEMDQYWVNCPTVGNDGRSRLVF